MEPKAAQEVDDAKAKLATVASSIGRDVIVFMRPAAVASNEACPRPDTGFQRFQNFLKGMEDSLNSLVKSSKATQAGDRNGPRTIRKDDPPEDFYDFTAADYAALQSSKKEDIYLKTKKIRDAEAQARKSRVVKATIRVQFPDNLILEADFKANDKVAVLIDLLQKAITRPELPFFIYTTPPKSRIKDYRQTLYDAGLAPSALVYFSHETEKGATAAEIEAAAKGPYLKPEIAELRDLHLVSAVTEERKPLEREQAQPNSADQGESSISEASKPEAISRKPSATKVPKWFKR